MSEDTLRGLLDAIRASSNGVDKNFLNTYLEKLDEYMEDEITFGDYPTYHGKGIAPLPSRWRFPRPWVACRPVGGGSRQHGELPVPESWSFVVAQSHHCSELWSL